MSVGAARRPDRRGGPAARGSARRARAAGGGPAPTLEAAIASTRRHAENRHRERAPDRAARDAPPGARFSPIRGNVDTRLRKLDAGELRRAGARVGRPEAARASRRASPRRFRSTQCVPAPGQGIVAIETQVTTTRISRRCFAAINDPQAAQALEAERAVVAALGGGCQLPLGRRRAARRRRPRHAGDRGVGSTDGAPVRRHAREVRRTAVAAGPAPGRRARRSRGARVLGRGTMTSRFVR